jgi:hypothetical protein
MRYGHRFEFCRRSLRLTPRMRARMVCGRVGTRVPLCSLTLSWLLLADRRSRKSPSTTRCGTPPGAVNGPTGVLASPHPTGGSRRTVVAKARQLAIQPLSSINLQDPDTFYLLRNLMRAWAARRMQL